jgi:hypothetical protein
MSSALSLAVAVVSTDCHLSPPSQVLGRYYLSDRKSGHVEFGDLQHMHHPIEANQTTARNMFLFEFGSSMLVV